MTKMAGMTIYNKNPLKIFFSRTVNQKTFKLKKKAKETLTL